MERILTALQMKKADELTINNLGISSEILVERAGFAVAEEIFSRFKGGRVLVCVGKGNNGADGMVIARLLSQKHGFAVSIFSIIDGNFDIFNNQFDIIVDCIFGIGLSRNIEGKYKVAIEKINISGAFVVSCDIPSGLNSDSGIPMGISVKSNLTVAIQEFKLGHFLNDGPDYCGETIVKDIGISVWDEDFSVRFNSNDVGTLFYKRNRNVHKGSFGKTAIIGGSKQFFGSVLLSANALCALKMGAGYSYLFIPNSLYNVYAGLNPECIISTFSDENGFLLFDDKDFSKILEFDSISFGMGVGVSYEVYKAICYLIENYKGNLLLDADALNSIAKFGVDILSSKNCRVVLTPHIGEFERLSGFKKSDIVQNPVFYAKDFARKYSVTILLKSSTSIITDGDKVIVNTTGSSCMAKAGSGDVLSGLTAGLLARENDLLLTTAGASYIFGKCGEFASKRYNEYTVTASELILEIPNVLNSL